ncbi:hypothetical protein BDW02DRAFT_617519 [Decorospora gaudefroyi]|uniref:Uncharacterized protein n=1 Tax=Decorospora gaudefroyi TaxID=184978 RepID=A0A6A5KK13_9PLEO|nr:hypothetical protein BDW02DRAFT_617519 [Decorospora gaudefroyi]
MPKPTPTQPHTGTYGLFDDPDETAQTTALAEAHELHRLEAVIRRQKRHDRYQQAKEAKAARRLASGKKERSRFFALFFGVFGGGGSGYRRGTVNAAGPEVEYRIVRKVSLPEPVYGREDVYGVDSLWLRECAMVKVWSKDPGGCHIVPGSMVGKGA